MSDIKAAIIASTLVLLALVLVVVFAISRITHEHTVNHFRPGCDWQLNGKNHTKLECPR